MHSYIGINIKPYIDPKFVPVLGIRRNKDARLGGQDRTVVVDAVMLMVSLRMPHLHNRPEVCASVCAHTGLSARALTPGPRRSGAGHPCVYCVYCLLSQGVHLSHRLAA